jgi:protein associated with RNAse G/E
LVEKNEEWIDLVGFFRETVHHTDLGKIEKGTVSRERFYLTRWYNYFIFEHPPGNLRNYYFNICMPPKISDGSIDYVDLDIDLIVWPDSRLVILDMEEFDEHADRFGYTEDVRGKALETLQELVALHEHNSLLKHL